MSDAKRAFYGFHSCMMEPWDGPASIAFTDGTDIGAVLDRNGLRPSRYTVTKGGLVVMASETGVLDIPPEEVAFKGRLQPGRMFLVDTVQGRIVDDEEIKEGMAARKPYRQWLRENLVNLGDLPELPAGQPLNGHGPASLLEQQQAFGYTIEDLKMLIAPMALNGQEAVGSMGNDAPLAVLSNQHPPLFNYFKQLFAQVTNPPLDPIREETGHVSGDHASAPSKICFEEGPLHCRQLRLTQPILTNENWRRSNGWRCRGLRSVTLSMLFNPRDGAGRVAAPRWSELCHERFQGDRRRLTRS